MEAELVGPVTILTYADLLGQAERGRNQREAPRSAGRRTVGDSDGPRCNICENPANAEPRGFRRVASSRRTGHRRRQIHCVYLRWPAVAGVKRPIARQQAARAGRVEDGGVLGHARVLEVSRCRSA